MACSSSSDVGRAEGDFTSNQATLLDFEFDGEVVAESAWLQEQAVEDQLLYTIGQLSGDRSVGRLDAVELSITETSLSDDGFTIKYHAKLPVAWGSKTNLPDTYELVLPRDVTPAGTTAFTETYMRTCVEHGAHDVDSGSMWYYYRPQLDTCELSSEQIVRTTATATKSMLNKTGAYPEYHQIWADDRFEALVIFGQSGPSGDASDAGVAGFNTFVQTMTSKLGASVVVTPANVTDGPGPGVKDVTFETQRADGKAVKVTALLVDSISGLWSADFAGRYGSLAPTADLIAYNGHAGGLGRNVQALARMARWDARKYQVFFMNGGDTYAYMDGSIAKERGAPNLADPEGTKYLEYVTNALPSNFESMAATSAALVTGFADATAPKTYDEIFEGVDDAEIVLVVGEEDNVYRPGMPLGTQP